MDNNFSVKILESYMDIDKLHDDINSFEITIYKQDGISQYTKDKLKAEQGGDN